MVKPRKPGKPERRFTRLERISRPKRVGKIMEEMAEEFFYTGKVPKGWNELAYRRLMKAMVERIGPRFWLREGQFSKATPAIKQFVARFPGGGMETVRAIINALRDHKFLRFESLPYGKIKQVYAKRSADQILKEKVVYGLTQEDMGKHHLVINGCVDYSNLLATLLRAKGIPAKVVRVVDHSVVHFYLEGKWFVGDCTKPPRTRIRENSGNLLKKYKEYEERGQFVEGFDSKSLGLNSIKDFYKYADKPRRYPK